MIRVVRKPPLTKASYERLKITLAGNHTLKQKVSMLLQVKFFLHEEGMYNAGLTDVYIPLIDADGHPLTNFRDGRAISDYSLVIESPYHAVADEYDDHRPARPAPLRPFNR